jgi:hypothetical protein
LASPTYCLSGAFVGGGVLNLEVGERTVLKRNGIAERTSIFRSQGYPSNPPQPRYTPYPDQATGGFVCDTTTIEAIAGGLYKTTVVWISIYTENTSYTTYDSKMIQVPIDQSPNFALIAGTPSSPANGAIFDANGIFVGFGPTPDGPSDFQGVVSAFIQQDLMIIHGSGSSPVQPSGQYFCESVQNTLRGAVWEWEITYNLDINIETGIPAGG